MADQVIGRVFKYCGKCQEGWLRVPDWTARRIYKNQTAMALLRCECRQGVHYQEYEKKVLPWKAPR